MRESNLSQLVGALGGWLEARPYGVEQDALDRAARIVLDMRLLGVALDDVDAPELTALDAEDRDVVDQARIWAQARREEARQRRAADERAARQQRVAAREAGPNAPFAKPNVPLASAPDIADQEQLEPGSVDFDLEAEPVGADEVEPHEPTAATVLVDPTDHDFFADTDFSSTDAESSRLRISPETGLKVAIVIWAIAALGVLAVLLRIALG